VTEGLKWPEINENIDIQGGNINTQKEFIPVTISSRVKTEEAWEREKDAEFDVEAAMEVTEEGGKTEKLKNTLDFEIDLVNIIDILSANPELVAELFLDYEKLSAFVSEFDKFEWGHIVIGGKLLDPKSTITMLLEWLGENKEILNKIVYACIRNNRNNPDSKLSGILSEIYVYNEAIRLWNYSEEKKLNLETLRLFGDVEATTELLSNREKLVELVNKIKHIVSDDWRPLDPEIQISILLDWIDNNIEALDKIFMANESFLSNPDLLNHKWENYVAFRSMVLTLKKETGIDLEKVLLWIF